MTFHFANQFDEAAEQRCIARSHSVSAKDQQHFIALAAQCLGHRNSFASLFCTVLREARLIIAFSDLINFLNVLRMDALCVQVAIEKEVKADSDFESNLVDSMELQPTDVFVDLDAVFTTQLSAQSSVQATAMCMSADRNTVKVWYRETGLDRRQIHEDICVWDASVDYLIRSKQSVT